MAEPVATTTEAAGDAPAALALRVPVPGGGAPVVVRSWGRSRWFVVQADPADPERGPVAVVSGHTSQQAATTALGRARSRASPGVGRGRCCRSAPPGRSAPGWCGTATPGGASCSPDRRPDRPADRAVARPVAVGVSGLPPPRVHLGSPPKFHETRDILGDSGGSRYHLRACSLCGLPRSSRPCSPRSWSRAAAAAAAAVAATAAEAVAGCRCSSGYRPVRYAWTSPGR